MSDDAKPPSSRPHVGSTGPTILVSPPREWPASWDAERDSCAAKQQASPPPAESATDQTGHSVVERQAGAMVAALSVPWSFGYDVSTERIDVESIARRARSGLADRLEDEVGPGFGEELTSQHLAGAADFFRALADALHGVGSTPPSSCAKEGTTGPTGHDSPEPAELSALDLQALLTLISNAGARELGNVTADRLFVWVWHSVSPAVREQWERAKVPR